MSSGKWVGDQSRNFSKYSGLVYRGLRNFSMSSGKWVRDQSRNFSKYSGLVYRESRNSKSCGLWVVHCRYKSDYYITGKVERKNQILGILKNHRRKLVIGMICITSIYYLGLKTFIKWTFGTIFVGFVSLFVIFTLLNRYTSMPAVLKLVEEEVEKHRATLENYIGHFDNPTSKSSTFTNEIFIEDGIRYITFRCNFAGTRGTAMGSIRTYNEKVYDENLYSTKEVPVILKMRVDISAIDRPDEHLCLMLVDKNLPTRNTVPGKIFTNVETKTK
jgi:hypothetical protein